MLPFQHCRAAATSPAIQTNQKGGLLSQRTSSARCEVWPRSRSSDLWATLDSKRWVCYAQPPWSSLPPLSRGFGLQGSRISVLRGRESFRARTSCGELSFGLLPVHLPDLRQPAADQRGVLQALPVAQRSLPWADLLWSPALPKTIWTALLREAPFGWPSQVL